ncbi:MAG: polymer-forming cytoskeletal protein [Bacteriovoracaceae bacterium]|nr:polymer-forming cytoskeletal protein [Bacteriovoracaceae bacterium]
MTDYINIKEQDFSFWGQGSKIKGEFHLKGPTLLGSIVEGELVMTDNAPLCVEREGSFKGTVKCHDIEIYGSFEGILQATGRATIYPSATLLGTIRAHDLIVHPGATLNIEGHTSDHDD